MLVLLVVHNVLNRRWYGNSEDNAHGGLLLGLCFDEYFDFEKSGFTVFLEYIAMMELWILIGYYMTKGVRRADGSLFR